MAACTKLARTQSKLVASANSKAVRRPATTHAALKGLACGVAASLALTVNPYAVLAQDVQYGAEVFTANCASCHTGGNNIVVPEKTLRKEALEKYLTGGFNREAIITQVTNGKGQMPAWGDKLDDEEIVSVAEYVYSQASNNAWP